MFLLLTIGSILSITLVFIIVSICYRPRAAKHPTFVGPDVWTNISLLTDTTTCSGATHFHDLSMSVTGFGKTMYGAVFQVYMITKNYVVITDYNLARLVMTGDNSRGIKESEKTAIARVFDLFPHCSTIFSSPTSDPERRASRKFLAPCFSSSGLKYTFEVILNSLVRCQQKLTAYSASGTVFDLNHFMIRLTFDVITESSFGVNWNTQQEDLKSDGAVFLHEADLWLQEGYRRAFNPFLKYCFWTEEYKRHALATERLVALLQRVASDYRSGRDEDAPLDPSIMGHLMRHQYEDENRRISDMQTFLIAGHETTSHSLTMMVVALCKHPSALRKLQAELDTAIPSTARHDSSQLPSMAAIRALPFLSGCIQESMRLHSVVAVGSMRETLSDIEYEGISIPAGSTCTLAFHSMFRQPWIDRAEDFLPERWDPSNPQERELRAMMMPFALGSRNCIGQNLAKMELSMIAAYLLRFFEFELLSEPSFHIFLTMKATNVQVKAHVRE